LGLNSVLTGTADPVGILATSGPGLDLDPKDWGPLFRLLSGRQDHRGRVLEPPDLKEAAKAAADLKSLGAAALVCASKFGPKNPVIEDQLFEAASLETGLPVMEASRLFGGLNFPRRLAGAVLNAAVKRLYDAFLDDLRVVAQKLGLTCPVFVLKADGGVMEAETARRSPALALAAGPAASLLGLWALSGGLSAEEGQEDVLMVDMGGTSADLAILSRGRPLLTTRGLTLAGRPTLVRGLMTRSLALGGDTDIELENGQAAPKARRRGPALALAPNEVGTRPPTLTDALNVLGAAKVGDLAASREAMSYFKASSPEEGAKMALEAVLASLKEASDGFIEALNSQPVYTISDYLVDWRLKPRKAVFLGGPAQALAPLAEKVLGLPCSAPEGAATANALGAALATPSIEAELYADTAMGVMSAPTLGRTGEIGQNYNLEQARRDLLELMGGGADLLITAQESFSQVSDTGRSGKVIRVSAQSAPSLAARVG
jgi:N-methylhydantoinase A/oxoprolinase/acetone carboxylase beta subunit